MANTYYDSQLTATEIEKVLEAISGILTSANNGKVLAISDGTIEARSVQWGGGSVVLEPLSVTANGDYTPEAGADGFNEVHVSVPNSYTASDEGKVVNNGALVAQTARSSQITQNGTYDTTLNDEVTVNVSGGGSAVVQPLSVTQNGTYNPPSGVDGYAPVTVNVPSSGGEGPIYYGASIPSPSLGNNEDLYIQYESKSSLYDYLYGIVAEYRKVNGDWIPYTKPVPATHAVHIWTHSTGGSNASVYIQEGYWDVTNSTFVPTGEAEDVIYTSVRSWDTAKDCYGLALLAYPSSWQIKASVILTDGISTYQADTIVASWGYSTQKDIYLWTPSNT